MAETMADFNKSSSLYDVTLETSSTVSISGSADTRWVISATRTGYVPVMFSGIIITQNSSRVVTDIETTSLNGNTITLTGYAKRWDGGGTSNYTVSVYVLWKKS